MNISGGRFHTGKVSLSVVVIRRFFGVQLLVLRWVPRAPFSLHVSHDDTRGDVRRPFPSGSVPVLFVQVSMQRGSWYIRDYLSGVISGTFSLFPT